MGQPYHGRELSQYLRLAKSPEQYDHHRAHHHDRRSYPEPGHLPDHFGARADPDDRRPESRRYHRWFHPAYLFVSGRHHHALRARAGKLFRAAYLLATAALWVHHPSRRRLFYLESRGQAGVVASRARQRGDLCHLFPRADDPHDHRPAHAARPGHPVPLTLSRWKRLVQGTDINAYPTR